MPSQKLSTDLQLRFVAFLQGQMRKSPDIVPGSSFFYWRNLTRRITKKKAQEILKRCRISWTSFLRGSQRLAKAKRRDSSPLSLPAEHLVLVLSESVEGPIRQEKLYKDGSCAHATITSAVWSVDLINLKGGCWAVVKRNGDSCLEGFYSAGLCAELRRVIHEVQIAPSRRARNKLPIGRLQKRLMTLQSS